MIAVNHCSLLNGHHKFHSRVNIVTYMTAIKLSLVPYLMNLTQLTGDHLMHLQSIGYKLVCNVDAKPFSTYVMLLLVSVKLAGGL